MLSFTLLIFLTQYELILFNTYQLTSVILPFFEYIDGIIKYIVHPQFFFQ